jgi:large subunit ribosomal protein L23
MNTADAAQVVKHPLATEKVVRLMESRNTLAFVVSRDASKPDIRKAVEGLFKAKVASVRTLITRGEKHAYVTFKKESPAIDIASNLGLM